MIPAAPEIAVLLACARAELRSVDIERARRATASHPDWGLVLSLARAHHLVPLLHRHVSGGQVAAPRDAALRLREMQTRLAQRNLRLARVLIEVLDLLGAASIDAMPLKGPVLADDLYGSVALRQFGDLDVLIDPAEIDRALGVLGARGFERLHSHEGLRHHERTRSHHVTMRHGGARVLLELHTRLLSPSCGPPISLGDLTGLSRERTWMGQPVHTLERSVLFVYLCQHGGGHAWSRLEWLATAAECAHTVQDWPAVWDASRRFRCASRVRAALDLMARVLDRSEGPRIGAVRANARVVQRLQSARAPFVPTSETFLYNIATDDGLRSRLRRVWTELALPHEADVRLLPLPRRFAALQYVLRPFRLLARAVGRRLGRQWFDGRAFPVDGNGRNRP